MFKFFNKRNNYIFFILILSLIIFTSYYNNNIIQIIENLDNNEDNNNQDNKNEDNNNECSKNIKFLQSGSNSHKNSANNNITNTLLSAKFNNKCLFPIDNETQIKNLENRENRS